MEQLREATGDFVAAVAAFIDAGGLLRADEAAVVAVSGGADSVALLAVLRELAGPGRRGYRLTVAHLDHGLRAGAGADAAFVADLARRWRIPCIRGRRDVGAIARERSLSVETAGRQVRYEFLAEAAARCGATAVAVGHHADDNAETVLERIVRGAALRGLAGIPASRPLAAGARLVRPLLQMRRERIMDFCRRRELTWRTDETNAQTRHRRNFIRHELLPLLREHMNPRADEALLRLAQAAEEADAHLADLGRNVLARADRQQTPHAASIDVAALSAEPAVVRAYALRAAIERLGLPMGAVTRQHLTALAELAAPGGRGAVNLPGGWVARRRGGELTLEAASEAQPAWAAPIPLACPGRTNLPCGRAVLCEIGPLDPDAFEAHCRSPKPGIELLDAEAVRGPLICRPRADGDAFVPLGSPGRQSVSDFLTNLKLPRRRRQDVLCVLDESGVVYVAPLRIAGRVRVTAHTRHILRIEIRQEDAADTDAGAVPRDPPVPQRPAPRRTRPVRRGVKSRP